MKIPEKPSTADLEKIKLQEITTFLPILKKQGFFFITDIRGKQLSSEQFADLLKKVIQQGKNPIYFLIGGSLGFPEDIYKQADEQISFSSMTFPHQLFRLILLEQIYRALTILKGKHYAK